MYGKHDVEVNEKKEVVFFEVVFGDGIK